MHDALIFPDSRPFETVGNLKPLSHRTIGHTKDRTKVFGIDEADSEAIVHQLVESDPYWQNGLWTEYDVKEWIQPI